MSTSIERQIEAYENLLATYSSLIEDQTNWISNLSNASSLIYYTLIELNKSVNWAGFYLIENNETKDLILGPFQGKVACQFIKFGKGVCGTCIMKQEPIVVPDVHKFEGHIACDGDTNSEIVIPIFDKDNQVKGLIDIDSLRLNDFNNTDLQYLQKLAAIIGRASQR